VDANNENDSQMDFTRVQILFIEERKIVEQISPQAGRVFLVRFQVNRLAQVCLFGFAPCKKPASLAFMQVA
jgi:hypothetical protein